MVSTLKYSACELRENIKPTVAVMRGVLSPTECYLLSCKMQDAFSGCTEAIECSDEFDPCGIFQDVNRKRERRLAFGRGFFVFSNEPALMLHMADRSKLR